MTTVQLERLGEQHLEAVEALLHDPDILHFTRIPEPPPEGFARTWIARYAAGEEDGTCAGFAALDTTGAFVGMALAPAIDREGAEFELGYLVAPEARGRGIGTAILRELTRWALEDAGALRAYLIIDVENEPSLRMAQRCGYVREGLLRSTHLKQGRRVDTTIWSRLPGDG